MKSNLVGFFANSLQRKLMLAITVLVTVVMGVVGIYWVNSQRQNASAELAARATQMAGLLGKTLAGPLWDIELRAIQEQLDAVMADPEVFSVALYEPGADQPLVMNNREGQVLDPIERESAVVYRREQLEQVVEVGTVRIVYTRQYMYQELMQTQLLVGVVILALVVALFGTTNILLRRMVQKPVQELVNMTSSIAGGALESRIQVTSSDEIGQLARSSNRMAEQLQSSRLELQNLISNLEQRVAERTADLEHRAGQLQAVTEVSRAVGSILDIDELLNTVVNTARERFELYYVGVFLVDDAREYAWLRAGTGEAGKEMLAREHKLAVGGTSMIGWCVEHGQARIALDVGEEAVRFQNPLLPDTHSEMALPLTTRGEVIGALTVQSDQSQAFSEDDVAVLQSMADQLANVIGNARLYEEAQRMLSEAERAQRRYLQEAWDVFTREQEEATGYLIEPRGARVANDLWTPEIQQAFAEQSLVQANDGGKRAALAVPLRLRDEMIGVLDLYQEGTKREWSDDEQALVEVVSEQLALALENARLFDRTQNALSLSERLYEASRKIAEARGEAQIYQILLEEYAWYAAADRVTLMLAVPEQIFPPEYLEVILAWDKDLGIDESVAGMRYSTEQFAIVNALPTSGGEPKLTHDVATDPEVDEEVRRVLLEQLGIRSVGIIPLVSGTVWFGIMMVQNRQVREFGEEELRFYRSLADRAAATLQTQRLLQTTTRRAQRERLAREIATKIRESADMDVIMQTAVVELGRALGARTFIELGTRAGND